MAKAEKKMFTAPEETRTFPKGKFEVLNFDGWTVGKAMFEPGWKWSESVKPIAKTDSCQTAHAIYVLSGHLHTVMDDGTVLELGPGDAANIPPGHDAWTVGSEACIALDFSGAKTYAAR
jgi:hypothetical protein